MPRIRRFTIENFRTFREPTTLDLSTPGGLLTLHGDNGSGKSNAIAAMELFFLAASGLFISEQRQPKETVVAWGVPWGASIAFGTWQLAIEKSDFEQHNGAAIQLTCAMDDQEIPPLTIEISARTNGISIYPVIWWSAAAAKANSEPGKEEENPEFSDPYAQRLEAERLRVQLSLAQAAWTKILGNPVAETQLFAVLDARRRPHWLEEDTIARALHLSLARNLYTLRTSRSPEDRSRWRELTSQIQKIPSLRGREMHVELPLSGGTPQLVFEEVGQSVLGLQQLSSGEQQLITILTSAFLARASILVIEEPEISLDMKNQKILDELLRDMVSKGQLDQVIIESHSPAFDGTHVLRFSRDDQGVTRATREQAQPVPEDLGREAERRGAKSSWVTADGYTRLPANMMRAIQMEGRGGQLLFLKGPDAWEAWSVEDFSRMMKGEGEGSS